MKTNLTTFATNSRLDDRLLTTKEASVIASMAPGTLARARVYGTPGYPPYCKIGKAVRYKLSTLIAWLEEQAEYVHTSQKN